MDLLTFFCSLSFGHSCDFFADSETKPASTTISAITAIFVVIVLVECVGEAVTENDSNERHEIEPEGGVESTQERVNLPVNPSLKAKILIVLVDIDKLWPFLRPLLLFHLHPHVHPFSVCFDFTGINRWEMHVFDLSSLITIFLPSLRGMVLLRVIDSVLFDLESCVD